MKNFAVVLFKGDKGVTVVPSSFVSEDKCFCFWPKKYPGDFDSMLHDSTSVPEPNWKRLGITFIKSYDTFERADKKVESYIQDPDADTSEGETHRLKRKNITENSADKILSPPSGSIHPGFQLSLNQPGSYETGVTQSKPSHNPRRGRSQNPAFETLEGSQHSGNFEVSLPQQPGSKSGSQLSESSYLSQQSLSQLGIQQSGSQYLGTQSSEVHHLLSQANRSQQCQSPKNQPSEVQQEEPNYLLNVYSDIISDLNLSTVNPLEVTSTAPLARNADCFITPDSDIQGLRQELQNFQLITIEKLEGVKEDISALRTLLTAVLSSQTSTENFKRHCIFKLIPVTSVEGLDNLEKELANDSSLNDLIGFFAKIGGSTPTSHVYNILKSTFSRSVSTKIRLTASTGKVALKDKLIAKAIREAVHISHKIGVPPEDGKLNSDIGRWFRNQGYINDDSKRGKTAKEHKEQKHTQGSSSSSESDSEKDPSTKD